MDDAPALALDEVLAERISQLTAGLNLSAEQQAQAECLLAVSEFARRVWENQTAAVAELIPKLSEAQSVPTLIAELDAELAQAADEAAVSAVLRRFRNLQLLRAAWRDINGLTDLVSILAEVTQVAEISLQAATQWATTHLEARFGVPRNRAGARQQVVVFGMGKLGGHELNFSSDIDLIFAWPEPGQADGDKALDNSEFFTRLARLIVQLMDTVTVDGFVFRTDVRLRPFGDAGPLAMHFNQMEDYFTKHGRDWERYAWVKARPVAGDTAAGNAFVRELRPFIYRRYPDYTVYEGLRRMKGMIAAEVKRKDTERNIKLGRGGIREIEFIAQVFQLVRGGQQRAFRRRRLLPTLENLAAEGELPVAVTEELTEAYHFLRILENRLQQLNDEQTHHLPVDTSKQQRIAWGMQRSWAEVEQQCAHWRERVHYHFQQVFVETKTDSAASAFVSVWNHALTPEDAQAYLIKAGFKADETLETLAERLNKLRCGRWFEALDEPARQALERVGPVLLETAMNTEEPVLAATRLLIIVEAIGRRGAYFSLLSENQPALMRLAKLCSASRWVTDEVASQPMLLDELLDTRVDSTIRSKAMLREQLADVLAEFDADDLEDQMDALRRFKNAAVLQIAVADLTDRLPIMQVSDALTEVAEVVLDAVLSLAWALTTKRYGVPHCEEEPGKARVANFAVVAYGKLGGIELGYSSDLDLVFLHDSRGSKQQTDGKKSIENAVFFSRLVQRIISMLSANTAAGQVYEVDTRLRPSGRSGLLVSSVEGFTKYQQASAWTWEHQALIRARVVACTPTTAAGSCPIVGAFEQVRKETLAQPRDATALREEVIKMRNKMRDHLETADAGYVDLKQSAGGITDIEFMVQYAVLRWAAEQNKLLAWTDNIRLLETLGREGLLSAADSDALINAYQRLRQRGHRLSLQGVKAQLAEHELQDERDRVSRIWQQLMAA